jgi:uncharacterized protein
MALRIINKTRGTLLADRAEEATRGLQRLKGLLGRDELPMGEGLLITPCNSIHMFFMRFPIDALFLDAQGTVVKLFAALPPWRATWIYPKARSVLELPAGVAAASGTMEGDQLAFERIAGRANERP